MAQSFVLWHRALVCDTELWGVTQSFWDVAQSFGCGTELLGCGTELWLWHRASLRNCVFLCKGTKLKNSACAEFLG